MAGRGIGRDTPARGMTLIEILVVLVLIAVIMSIVGGNFIGQGEKAKADAAKIEIGQISQTLDLYKLEIGRYPDDAGRPAGADHARRRASTNWNGPYWKKATVPKDPWGNEYKYARRRRTRRTRSSRSAPTARKAAKARTRTSRSSPQ